MNTKDIDRHRTLVCPQCGDRVPYKLINTHITQKHDREYATCIICCKEIRCRDYFMHSILCQSATARSEFLLRENNIRPCVVKVERVDMKLYTNPIVVVPYLRPGVHFDRNLVE